ncbi:MAG: oligosaccharyl transferase, archaeosortase A system-associated [Methanomicrobiales archaeon]
MKPIDASGIATKFYNIILSSNRINILLLILLGCCSFFIRILPLLSLQGDLLNNIDPYDSLYLLRQVELMLANFPSYNFFEPMTLFPVGQNIHWGPVLPFIITLACLVAGASTRQEIVSVAVLVPPLLGALLIPLVYLIGVKLHNRSCGIIAALFIAVVPGNFFDVSSFGIIDHHVAEALFGCAFILTYIVALQVSRQHDNKSWNSADIVKIIAACSLCGIMYLLGYLNIAIIIIFALVAMVFTAVQAVVDFHAHRDSRYLVIVNSVVFGIALAGSLLVIQDHVSFSLVTYSLGHVAACLFIILATLALYILSIILRKRPFITYPAVLIVTLSGALIAAALLLPSLYYTAIYGLIEGLGQKVLSVTVIESLPMDPATLWSEYNIGLLLLFGGFVMLGWKVWRKQHPLDLLCLVWGFLIFVLAIQHTRYDYLLATPFAVISGFCVSSVIEYGKPGAGEQSKEKVPRTPIKEEHPGRKAKKVKKTARQKAGNKDEWRELLLIGVVLFSIGFVGASAWSDLHKQPIKPQDGWIDALNWLKSNSPDPGIDYYKNYPGEGFKYPDQAYGVMSWWDYGHMITYFAHRIPNTNPFQSGVQGRTGGAAFFMSGNETDAVKILDIRGSRYVITDYPMVATKFWAIAMWNDSINKTAPYIVTMKNTPGNNTREIQKVQFLTPAFFSTMVSHLQLFDGSGTEPVSVDYVEYLNASGATNNPTIRFMKEIYWKDSVNYSMSRQEGLAPGVNTVLLSRDYMQPSTTLPALKHFRLVYESPETISGPGSLHRVKIFEYVKGARVNGSGIITLDLETNTGRKFQYIQESENGAFILPYATDVPNGAVRALGHYIVLPGNMTFNVTDSAVVAGAAVN